VLIESEAVANWVKVVALLPTFVAEQTLSACCLGGNLSLPHHLLSLPPFTYILQ